jgi:hypothetical protein
MAENMRQRLVRFASEESDAVPLMMRTNAAVLTSGVPVEIELGVRWITQHGHRVRVDGHWVPCVVVAENAREVVVELRRR